MLHGISRSVHSRMLILAVFWLSALMCGRLSMEAQQPSSMHDADERDLLRTINFGSREIHLPLQERNDRLALQNALLQADTARLSGEEQDLTGIQVARYFVEISKEEMRASALYSWVWSPTGSEKDRQQLEVDESKFDDASRKCHERANDGKKVVFTSLQEAQAACSELTLILERVAPHKIPTGKTPSVFTNDKEATKRIGYALYVKDQKQVLADRLHLSGAKRKVILNQDLGLIDQDKQLWLMEISEDNETAFNLKYPQQPMASGRELFEHMLGFRNQIASAITAMRVGK